MMLQFKKVLRLSLVLSFLLAMLAPQVFAADFPANPTTKTGYSLDFQEEFNSPTLDTNKWLPYYLPHWTSDKSKAAARYTIENGSLVERIDADTPAWNPSYDSTVKISSIQSYEKDWWHRFNSSMPNDHHEPTFNGYSTKYGYFEIRAKFSNVGGGGHQAWWMVGTQDDQDANGNTAKNDEIDIIESFFSKPQTWRIATYGWGDPNFSTNWILNEDPVPSGSPTTEYHVYAMEWTPTSLKFYYDNQLYKTINQAPQNPMGMILGIYTDAGSGVHNATFPKQWNVDYVRVWKKDGGYPEPYYRFKNHQTGEYMHIEQQAGKVQYGTVPATYWSSQWTKEMTADGYIRFKNRWTGNYMIAGASGNVEYSNAAETDTTSNWTEEVVSGYKRYKNRANGQYMHTEGLTGYVQTGSVPATYWTSQWAEEVAPN
ncbi:family 16 glycosylhydrolase [Paenibacillus alba]|uniref:Family 16 glycosylhydrolase n=1 Tax=Paenibacillus alba TaxID=1197127 RepID=A0ABU6G2Y4_9BACL|nr:family 16 glycosylhydrolase [Paenibacillus alba]MEC0228532.1 family 16 glycosylhydrolase [Paenibacillus alba]